MDLITPDPEDDRTAVSDTSPESAAHTEAASDTWPDPAPAPVGTAPAPARRRWARRFAAAWWPDERSADRPRVAAGLADLGPAARERRRRIKLQAAALALIAVALGLLITGTTAIDETDPVARASAVPGATITVPAPWSRRLAPTDRLGGAEPSELSGPAIADPLADPSAPAPADRRTVAALPAVPSEIGPYDSIAATDSVESLALIDSSAAGDNTAGLDGTDRLRALRAVAPIGPAIPPARPRPKPRRIAAPPAPVSDTDHTTAVRPVTAARTRSPRAAAVGPPPPGVAPDAARPNPPTRDPIVPVVRSEDAPAAAALQPVRRTRTTPAAERSPDPVRVAAVAPPPDPAVAASPRDPIARAATARPPTGESAPPDPVLRPRAKPAHPGPEPQAMRTMTGPAVTMVEDEPPPARPGASAPGRATAATTAPEPASAPPAPDPAPRTSTGPSHLVYAGDPAPQPAAAVPRDATETPTAPESGANPHPVGPVAVARHAPRSPAGPADPPVVAPETPTGAAVLDRDAPAPWVTAPTTEPPALAPDEVPDAATAMPPPLVATPPVGAPTGPDPYPEPGATVAYVRRDAPARPPSAAETVLATPPPWQADVAYIQFGAFRSMDAALGGVETIDHTLSAYRSAYPDSSFDAMRLLVHRGSDGLFRVFADHFNSTGDANRICALVARDFAISCFAVSKQKMPN